MANGWGGYRAPSNPAVVSGPGAGSARTDGGVMNPNSPSYGEVADVQSLKAAAPLAGGAGARMAATTPQPTAPFQSVGFGNPTGDPNMPVTAGAAAGEGPGPEVMGLGLSPAEEAREDVRALGPSAVQALIAAAGREDATPSFKRLARAALYT